MIGFGNIFLPLIAPDPSSLNFFDNFGNSKTVSHSGNLKLNQLNCKKNAKFAIPGNCFSNFLLRSKFCTNGLLER